MGVVRGVDVRAGDVARGALILVLLLEVCVEGDAHVAAAMIRYVTFLKSHL